MAGQEYRCQDCGREFELPDAVKTRYPNWTPKQCLDCREGRTRRGTAPGGALTPEEVLKRYTGGPQDGVFTDGSCSGNPGPGGWGAVRVSGGTIVEQRLGKEPATTNNRMELTAMAEGLSMVAPGESVTLYSDSQLVVNTLSKWAAGWEQRGWRRKDGPVKNLDLVQRAWTLLKERPGVRLEWIRAHDGSRWNEYVDALATTYMRDRPA